MVNGKILTCPDCGGNLKLKDKIFQCNSCHIEWPIKNGIPCFLRDIVYWGEIDKEEMMSVLSMTKTEGWKNSLDKVVKKKYPKIYQSITANYRADFRVLLPLNKHTDVLDIGAGWGQISFLLAPFVRTVWALESVRERVQFMLYRKGEDDIENIEPIWGSALSPPFATKSFDVVIMNGVLEWIGTWNETKPPNKVQKDALSIIHSLLRPGGFLYIGIENRYGANNFLGAIDHSGYRFTSLMPRWMANLYVKTRGQNYRSERRLKSYRTYTYSYYGYKRLLENIGFASINIYAVLPHYARPLVIFPLEDENLIHFFFKYIFLPNSLINILASKTLRLPLITRTVKLFAPHFIIIAKRTLSDE